MGLTLLIARPQFSVLSSQFSEKSLEARWLIADGYFVHQQAIMALIKIYFAL